MYFNIKNYLKNNKYNTDYFKKKKKTKKPSYPRIYVELG